VLEISKFEDFSTKLNVTARAYIGSKFNFSACSKFFSS
jgi:hypothetical protein